MKTNRILAMLLCIAMLLTVVAVTASCKKSPEQEFKALSTEQKFTTSLSKTAEQAGKWELLDSISKVAEAGSAQIKVTLDESFLGEGAPAMDIDAKFYLNSAKYAADASVKIGEDTYAAKAYVDPAKSIVIDSQSILGGVYGVDLTTLVDDFKNFALVKDLPEEQLAAIQAQVEEYVAMVKDLPSMLNVDTDANSEKFAAIISKSILDNVALTSEEKAVKVFGKDVNATCISFTIDNEAVSKILPALVANLKADTELMAELKDMYDALSKSVAAEDLEGMTFEDCIKSIEDAVAEVAGEIKESEAFSVKVVLSLSSVGVIMRVDLELNVAQIPAKAAIELGEKLDKFEGFALSVTATPAEGVTVDAGVSLLVEEDSADNYKLKFETKGLATLLQIDDITATYARNKKTGDAALKVNIPDEGELEIGFNYVSDKGTLTFKNFSVKMGGEAAPIPPITLILKEKDTMPTAPDYKNLMKLTEEEFGTLSETVSEKIAPLMGLFGFEEDDEYGEYEEG